MPVALTALVWVLIAAAVLLFIVVFAIHTDWGRDRLRQAVEREAAEHLHGELRVGSIQGSVLGDFALRDAAVTDEEGEVVLAAERVRVKYQPLELLRRRLVIDHLEVESPHAHARVDAEARVNLVEVLDLPPPDPDVDPLDLTIEELSVSRGAADVDVARAEVASVDDLTLRASAHIVPSDEVVLEAHGGPSRPLEEARVALEELSATVRGPDPESDPLALGGGGRFRLAEGAFTAEDLHFGLGASFAQMERIAGDRQGRLSGDVALHIRAADVRRLAPDPPWIGDVEIAGSIEREQAGTPISVPMTGTAAGAPLSAYLAVDPDAPRADVDLELSRLDPSAAVRGAPEGALETSLRASARGHRVPGPLAEAELSARGTIADQPLGRAEVGLRYDRERARLDFDLAGGRPRGAFAATGQVDVDLREDRLRARAPELAVRTRDLVWRADRASFARTPAGDVVIERLELRSGAGSVAAEGLIRGREAGRLEVRIQDLDLARLRRSLAPDALPWEGTLELRARGSWPPERGRVSGEIDDLTMPLLTAIDLDFDVALADDEVTTSLRTLGDDAELVEVVVVTRAPEPIHDTGAWADLGLGAIEELALEIADVEVIPR